MAFLRSQLILRGQSLVRASKSLQGLVRNNAIAPRVAVRFIHSLKSHKCLLSSTQNLIKPARSCWTTHQPAPTSTLQVKEIEKENDILLITWNDNVTDKFPYCWLRDCCLCDECYVFTSKARKFVMQHMDPDIRPDLVNIDNGTKTISITWQGGHVSEYGFEWLHQRAFNNKNRQIRQKWLPPAHELWGKWEMEDRIPTDTLKNVLSEDKALFNFLFEMEKKGIFLLREAPLEVGQLEKIADRVAFMRTTNYGVTFHVQVKADASNAAYTSAALGLHTDVPFYEYIPGVWMTHCIKQYEGKGGGSQISDAFYVAEKMRRERPDLFNILTTTPIDYYDVGDDHYKFYLLQQDPIIKLDQHGCIAEVAYNNQDRDYYLDLPPEKVKPLYTALRYWDDMMYREENHITFKLQEGDIIALDNRRVLHGRTGFGNSPDGTHDMSRHLEGIYLDWDEIRSKRRVLQYDLGLDEHPPIY